MVDFSFTFPYLDHFFDVILSVLAPVVNLIFFLLIVGVSFAFLKIFMKVFMLGMLLWSVVYDAWIKYNRDELSLKAYKNHKTAYTYDADGLKKISDLFKDATSFW